MSLKLNQLAQLVCPLIQYIYEIIPRLCILYFFLHFLWVFFSPLEKMC